jgi:hypothetical protein
MINSMLLIIEISLSGNACPSNENKFVVTPKVSPSFNVYIINPFSWPILTKDYQYYS